ncbi:DUF2141 domain-containing protein [Flavobacteriaceae bacterium]|nr:DUF2141 domain-containing protein [Flavobacteriaceae bacterium]
MRKLKLLFFVLIMLTLYDGYSQSKKTSLTLTIEVSSFENTKGVLRVCVTDQKDDFLKSCAFSKIVTVEDDTVSLKIENIEKGNYAVSVFHDENNSGILETGGVFGIPLEPYGFSNNPNMRFGPSYKKSVFKMTSDKNISIKLK